MTTTLLSPKNSGDIAVYADEPDDPSTKETPMTEASAKNSIKSSDGRSLLLFEKLGDIFRDVGHNWILHILSTVLEVVSRVVRGCDYNVAGIQLVKLTAAILKCDGVRLIQKDDDSPEIDVVAVFPTKAPDERISLTAIKWAGERKESILVADLEKEQFPFDENIAVRGIQSIICTSLDTADGVRIGYLYLDRLKGHAPFRQIDRQVIDGLRTIFSELLAGVIEKEKQAEQIRVLQAQSLDQQEEGLIYESATMRQTVERARKLASIDVPLLIEGETGTGKEVLARLIHRTGKRSDKVFIAINCGAIPEHLMESEFFGHEKGSFTGANAAKKGHFVSADGGTLFLDEISELPMSLQVKLLRVLQEKEIYPVGSSVPVKVDVRILTALNKNLEVEVREGRFRQDLYFRLNVVRLPIPPLRDRDRDAIILANHFLKHYTAQYGIEKRSFSKSTEKAIIAYRWPGNVRELQNRIQHAVILSTKETITTKEMDFETAMSPSADTGNMDSMQEAREKAERAAAIKALTRTSGNVSLASKLLQMDRMVLSRLLEKLQIDPSEYKRS